ncbi:hypothetical protein XELAEV_18038630mg [Xenopus laevis]|uniref:Uncharacterized protein n=1 Tax=Xenopus laevis TaxID=8355 RepID=A0A974C7K3_XENLA|nr:hypothetical protein XELAEV_18038630mg [Xenopus laevis]
MFSFSQAVRSNLKYIENKIKETEELQEVARTHLVERPTLALPRLSRMKKVKRAIGKRFRRISDSTRRLFQCRLAEH